MMIILITLLTGEMTINGELVQGRATILMPHPERCFRAVQMSYRTPGTFEGEIGPWMKMFQNARNYVG